jgi:hypothetical protein
VKNNIPTKEVLQIMYKKMTCQEMAKNMNVATSTIIRWLEIANIPRRGQGTHRKIWLAGKTIGSWTIIKEVKPSSLGHPRWLCRCKCGKELIKETNTLRSRPKLMCAKCRGKNNRVKGRLSNVFWRQITYGAKKRGKKIKITSNDAYGLLLSQHWKCSLSGLPLIIAETVTEHQHGGTSASLDRINPYADYELGNIQWVHKDINRIKYMMNNEDFFSLCVAVSEEKQIKSLPYLPNMISNTMWHSIEYSARCRHIKFNLTKDDAWSIYLLQGGKCALTGEPISFPHSTYTWRKFNDGTVSLDRIDNTKGYKPDNVQWIRKDINKAKGKMDHNRFKLLCRLVADKVFQSKVRLPPANHVTNNI